MKIILINPPYFGIENDRLEQNLGIAYLAAVLRENGYKNTELLELTGKDSLEDSLKLLPKADIYGISCYTTSYSNVLSIIQYIKSIINKKAYIILGGPHPSALPEETLRESTADLVIVGEGESSIVKAVQSYDTQTPLRGIIYGEEISKLDEIPFPIRLLGKEYAFSRTFHGEPTVSLIATRGCPNNCIHCNSNIMGAGSKGVRSRSVENIICEIHELKRLGVYNFRFNDDNFLAHRDVVKLLSALARENIHFRIFGHMKFMTKDICRMLRDSGCDFISVGIESMNPNNLKFLRKLDNLRSIENLKNAAEYGLHIRASFIVGLPFDTDETIEKYFQQATLLKIHEFAVYPLIPYPGTMLAKNALKYHYTILSHKFDSYMQMGVNRNACYCLLYNNLETGNRFGPEDVKRWKNRAESILCQSFTHMRESNIAQ